MEKDIDYYDSLPKPEISIHGKRKINRLFREIVGSSKIPHPEVDNNYERIRSNIMRKLNLLKYKLNID